MIIQTPINKHKNIQELADMALKQVLDDTTADGVTIREWLDKIASGEYQPVKHGRWRHSKVEGLPTNRFVCSECDGLFQVSTYRNSCMFKYCPNCGAKMDGGAE